MAFSNETISAPIKGKPHIVLINGWWRVSSKPRQFSKRGDQWWSLAHQHVAKLNGERRR